MNRQEDLGAVIGFLDGLSVEASSKANLLRTLLHVPPEVVRDPVPEPTWRERLWSCPPETRLNADEAAEAMGRSRSWIYKHTMQTAEDRLPVRKLAGELVFVASELRAWIEAHEEILHGAGRHLEAA